MAAEAQFASLDGAVSHGAENGLRLSSNSIARRSVSIFSRRGTESPEPRPPFIAQAAMRKPKQLTERQRSWIKRKSAPASNGQPKPKGTILNAVPPAKTIQLSVFEQNMLTSPNEEILSAVGGGSPTQIAMATPIYQTTSAQSSVEQTPKLWSKGSVPLAQRTQSGTQRENNTRIGMWVDGVAHWDGHSRPECAGCEEPSVENQTGFTSLSPTLSTSVNAPQTRPHLSVIIPVGEPLINDRSLSTIVQPTPHRPVVSVAPASIVTKYGLSMPKIRVEEPYVVSPLQSTSRQQTPPPHRPKAPLRADSNNVSPPIKIWTRSSPSSPSSLDEHDDASEYSQRSSATSIEVLAAGSTPEKASLEFKNQTPSASGSHSSSGDFDHKIRVLDNVNKPLPPIPILPPQRAAPAPPSSPSSIYSPAHSINRRSTSLKSASGERVDVILRRVKHSRSSRSLSELDLIDQAYLRAATHYSGIAYPSSPTLSEAEDDLEVHLSSISDDGAKADEGTSDCEPTVANAGSIRRSDSVRSVMQPPERAPTLPKRSRRREWRVARSERHAVQFSKSRKPRRRRSESYLETRPNLQVHSEAAKVLWKSTSAAQLSRTSEVVEQVSRSPDDHIPPTPRIVINDGLIVLHVPLIFRGVTNQDGPFSSASAEEVLLRILSALPSAKDLFHTALINKGMYRVFKENEMQLVRDVTYNQSPAAWEYREWCPPECPVEAPPAMLSEQLEHTPLSYMRCHRRDLAVIESLKALILESCSGFIRRETAFALSTHTHPHAQRFNDAFWRIWCFCKIFGCGKGREEDITGQLDWLKGGLLANNQDLTATMNMNLDFDMGSVLLNPPEYFAKGNSGGLSAQQLYDMSEIWSCLTTILSGYHGRAKQARQNGIFDGCDLTNGTVESDEQALEEWTAYLLTLGPAVVLEMAAFAKEDSSTGFAFAKINGWTQWDPVQSGDSRTHFLKEPVARLYEERVAAAALKLQNPREQERKELSRKRVANLAAEIKLKRQASGYRRLPMIDMSMERPMSAVSRQTSTMSFCSVQSQSSDTTRRTSTSMSSPRPPNFSVPHPRSPPSSLWSPRKISPIIEGRVETFNRMSQQNFAGGVAENTSERAVKQIVDMGFSASQAREALRMTDMGDGLRVDRAVDMLLRRQKFVF